MPAFLRPSRQIALRFSRSGGRFGRADSRPAGRMPHPTVDIRVAETHAVQEIARNAPAQQLTAGPLPSNNLVASEEARPRRAHSFFIPSTPQFIAIPSWSSCCRQSLAWQPVRNRNAGRVLAEVLAETVSRRDGATVSELVPW